MLCDIAIPTLPSRDLTRTLAFYRQLGFEVIYDPSYADYAIVHRGSLEIHFFAFAELIPTESYQGCYLRVSQVDEFLQAFAQLSLPTEGIPRLVNVEDKPWGMREFAIVDPDGNLLRIGQVIPSDA